MCGTKAQRDKKAWPSAKTFASPRLGDLVFNGGGELKENGEPGNYYFGMDDQGNVAIKFSQNA